MMTQDLGLLVQFGIAVAGCCFTWRIYKLINHGNGWWLMSAGFLWFMIQTLVTAFAPKDVVFLSDFRLYYSPIITRGLFLISVWRILTSTINEHESKIFLEKQNSENINRVRELSNKINSVVINCEYWDSNANKCIK